MNPIELTKKGTDKVVALACGDCGTVYRIDCDDIAGWCCSTVCKTCGQTVAKNSYCPYCSRAREEETELRHFTKAEKISADTYMGPVYLPEIDKYYETLGDMEEGEECDARDLPAYVWACHVNLLQLHIESAIENMMENAYEDASEDDLTDLPELLAFVEEWNKKQTLSSWEPDYSRAVVLSKEVT